MPICHSIIQEFVPTPGGLQESLLRIALLINSMDGWTARVYVRDEQNRYGEKFTVPGLEVFLVGAERLKLMQPVSLFAVDRFRADFLILRREIERSIRDHPSDPHLLLSFGVTQTGFIAQQVATSLGVPHITCFRGTDFSRDCFDPVALPAISYVVQRATAIVTTNEEQRQFLKAAFGPGLNIATIYNGVELPRKLWRPQKRSRIRLTADCGFAFKKGTHILLNACEVLLRGNLPIEVSLCGPTAEYEQAYWEQTRNDLEARFDPYVRFQGLIDKPGIETKLLDSDLYCSATLGEGCSLARSRAFVLGMPIVSTRCGELADLAANVSHIMLAAPGDAEGFQAALRCACVQAGESEIPVDMDCVEHARSVLSIESERAAWRNLLTGIAGRSTKQSTKRQFRIVMYAHDGRGLGHLRRLCRIAKALQGACAVLLITGHRAASWLVPETCEFFHLPSIDNLDRRLSAHWGRNPFWDAGRKEGLRVRQAAIDSIIGSFAPDAIIMDYLAAGKDDEMYTVLDRFPARRYLLLRGVLDDLAAVQRDILNPTGLHLLEKRYDRVLVMADRKIVDVVAEYELSEAVAEKVIYAGYVADQIDESMREQTRVERGIPKAAKWVVCSAGGGKEGEDLVEHCFKITGEFPEVFFDIVVGPRSRSALESTTAQGSGRVRVSKERVDLPRLHGSCDVLVCRGGYNSLMEGAIGRTRIIVVPTADDHEQLTHATRLAAFLPVAVIEDVHLLATRLRDELAAEPRDDTKVPLDFTGADSAARIILGDLLESRR